MPPSSSPPSSDPLAPLKQQAAERAVAFVQSGMVLGLGAGSTAVFALRRLGQLLADGTLRDIIGVPCSLQVDAEARRVGIPVTSLDDHPALDLTIDGADEVDPQLNLIKGGGGALLREKMVAQASRREIIVVDEGKLSPHLGVKWAVPVEVIPFGWRAQARFLEGLGARAVRREHKGAPYFTDQGNFILDCRFGPLTDPLGLAHQLGERAGIVEHGLFLGLATDLIVAGVDGVQHRRRGEYGYPGH